jgi:hypothetical protein
MPVNRELEPLTLHVETRKEAIYIEDSADQGRLRALGQLQKWVAHSTLRRSRTST